MRELRDPIHGFIERSEVEQKLIDTCVFQRLRGIKQLAMADLVYPGATHTRFSHSIGVMHVTGRMAKQLGVDEDQDTLRMIREAALLHDIGHGPFSHVSEDLLDKYYDKSRIKTKSKEKIHEKLTCDIIDKSNEIRKYISEDKRRKIIDLISGIHHQEPIVRNIVSGPLDADKLDYLLRDSYFCGVKYGIYDIERLIGTLVEHTEESGDKSLAANDDGIYAIEQFVLAKYHLSMQVYRHKIRLVTDAMIVRALELGIEKDKLPWLIRLYKYDGTLQHLDEYLQWDDCRVINQLLYSGEKKGAATDIFQRLKERRLFKRVFSKLVVDIDPPIVRPFLASINKSPFKKEIEKRIASELSKVFNCEVNPDYVVVSSFTIKSVREQSRNNEGSIIIMKGKEPRKFENESALFDSIDERQKEQYIEVYAPVSFESDVDKRKKMKELNDKISSLLIQEAKSAEQKAKAVEKLQIKGSVLPQRGKRRSL